MPRSTSVIFAYYYSNSWTSSSNRTRYCLSNMNRNHQAPLGNPFSKWKNKLTDGKSNERKRHFFLVSTDLRYRTSQLIVDPFSRRGQALQGVAVRKRREVFLVLVLSLWQQLLPLHEGVVELFVRVGEDHLVVELCHHRLSQKKPGNWGTCVGEARKIPRARGSVTGKPTWSRRFQLLIYRRAVSHDLPHDRQSPPLTKASL